MKRSGFTLIEMLIVIVMIGLMLTVALPYLRNSSVKESVRGAMDAIASLHAVAKQTAIQRGRTTRLVMYTSSGLVYAVARNANGTAFDTVGSVHNIVSEFGVTFTTTRDTLTFSPRGLGTETSGTTIIITKSTHADTLSVSAAGRLVR